MSDRARLLIVGAGPFGLGLARYARVHGIEHRIVGTPMSFWRNHMPKGMVLRSGIKWHLDPEGRLTFRRYARERSLGVGDLEPMTRSRYLDYVEWFQASAGIDVTVDRVEQLELVDGEYRATLRDGGIVRAARVALALGFEAFAHTPRSLAALVPPERRSHSRDAIDPASYRGQRVAIVGGRQSAYELAVLLAEAGAARIDVVHRHAVPAFERSDWSWVEDLLAETEAQPGWYRSLGAEERRRIQRAFWNEGRLKLEPWLASGLQTERVRVWSEAGLQECRTLPDGSLKLRLGAARSPSEADRPDTETRSASAARLPAEILCDHIVMATGYRVDVARWRMLGPRLRSSLQVRDGSPELGPTFEASVPGLFVTSLAAARDFGPFLGFTVSVRTVSRIVGRAIAGA